ncbi:MAG: ATP-binding protein, partial [Candidatus Cryptobacteroides sp.]
ANFRNSEYDLALNGDGNAKFYLDDFIFGGKMTPSSVCSTTIEENLPVSLVNKISGLANNLILNAEIEKKNNCGETLVLHILRSSSIAITSSGKIYIRIGDNSVPVTSSEDIIRLAADKNSFSWEDALSPYEWQKADKGKLDKFIADIKSSDRVSKFVKDKETKEILDYFYLTDSESDMMTNLGVLFIGRNTQRGRLSNAPIVQCIKYDEYGEKVNKWVWDDYLLNPQELIDNIWETVPEWTETYEISDGMRRKNVPAYEEAVIREILCNSLVHRPYTIRGDIFINIYPDRIEVVNPGQLPLGITPENILHKTYKRNEHFAAICYVLHLMEREGSGYDKMYELQLSLGKSVPQVIEGDDYVKAIVERRIRSVDALKLMQDVKERFPLKQKALICLGFIAQYGPVSGSELVNKLDLSGSDALRAWLNPLLENGLVESTDDKTQGKKYYVADNIKHLTMKKTARQMKHDLIRDAILQYIVEHKDVSIAEVAERLGGQYSYKVIRKIVLSLLEEGIVQQSGKGRWTRFILVE